jgi:hypothetical protein
MTVAKFEKGARVSFFRAADKQTRLSGAVEEVQGEEILVRTDGSEVLVWAMADEATLEAAPEAPQV